MNVAMLSFAHVHAEGYADAVEAHPDLQLAAIWDEPGLGGEAAAEERDVPFFDDLDEILARGEIEGVVVNAPTDRHEAIIVAAAEAGKHIFTEKALALDVAACDRIIEAVERNNVAFVISLPQRSHPEVLLAKQAVEEGWLGHITQARARIAHAASLDGWFEGDRVAWFHDVEQAGGGALFDLGCHRVDVMRWLLGEPVGVTARLNQHSSRYAIDDNAVMVVEFANRALAVVDVSWVHRAGPNPLELYGTEGFLMIGGANGPELVSHQLTEAEKRSILRRLPDPLPSPMEQWADACLAGRPPLVTVHDGRNLTELLQAAYLSQREERHVALPLTSSGD